MSRVLVVDDEPGLRQSLGLLLADAGYDVVAEGDGKRGLERALAEPFDLILCDVRMPGLDGLAFLRGYRERGGDGLVIMMSAYGGEDAAIPESLLESELFGHARGAFTGATTESMGLFEAADGGTLLLDEIGELPLGLQAKLLRVLQDGEIRRVGDQRNRRVDVRLLAATARDLAVEAKAGRFREDLYYRLNVVAIHLPPLRERPEDIAPLARLFAAQLSRRLGRPLELGPAALAWVERQPWPGNVRELEHAIERGAVLTDKHKLDVEDLQKGPAAASPTAGAGPGNLRDAADAAERAAIQSALEAAGGNRRDAAKRLGVSLRTLFYKMARLKLE